MENIFYEENVSLPTYFPLKDLHGKVWNVDSIFQQNKMVFRFTQHDCEDCIRFEANLIRNRGMSSHTVGIASYDNLRLLRLAIEKYHIDFPVYFLPFNQEKEVFASVNTIRKPFLFMMSDDLHSHYFFFPNKEQPKVSEIYYQEIRNRLSAESSQSDNIFENTSVDLGDVKIGKSKKAHFKITNQTDGLLVIKDIKTSCGCTTPQWDKRPIRAGQLSELTVIFKAETHGYNKKNIMVFHNKTKYPIRLTITANVTE